MLLLDTNVISEVMRPAPSPTVMRWLAEQPIDLLHVSAVTVAEIHFGLQLVDPGDRRDRLSRQFDRLVTRGFAARVVDFDHIAAIRYGALHAKRRREGQPMSVPDAQIAASAQAHDLALVTRNTRDFEGLDVVLIDPFSFESQG